MQKTIHLSNKLLFLYLKTGGGHLAPAKALTDWITQHKDRKAEIDLCDGFNGVFPFVKWIIEDGYKHSQAKGKWIFELLYAVHKIKFFAHLTSWLVSIFVTPTLERRILTTNPSKIIIFHFFLIKPVQRIIKRKGLKIPVLTVVTDPFTAHPIWFLERNQHFVVFSSQLKQYLETVENVEPSKISVFPFIVNPKFSKPLDPDDQYSLREKLGLIQNSKIILLLGGGDGIPHGEKLLKNLAKSNLEADVVIVCGRNTSLFRKALRIKVRYNFERLKVLGFIDYVYELLSISEVVITKCGASTFSEVLLCGKIPLVNSYIWEQERGNVDFIKENGMGVYEPNPKRIANLAREIIGSNEYNGWFKQNIQRMGLSNGTPLVSDFILQFN